jgi:hypothetical protein
MLTRRELFAGGIAGGLAAPAGAGEVQADREFQREIASGVQRLSSSVTRYVESSSLSYGPIAKLRDAQNVFLRSNSKFPDFCEIGINVFYEVYDWHVKHQQQMTIARQPPPDGRYAIQFMFTALVLRPEVDPNYIGVPFDKA